MKTHQTGSKRSSPFDVSPSGLASGSNFKTWMGTRVSVTAGELYKAGSAAPSVVVEVIAAVKGTMVADNVDEFDGRSGPSAVKVYRQEWGRTASVGLGITNMG